MEEEKKNLSKWLDSMNTLDLHNALMESRAKYNEKADEFWEALSYEDKLKAFYSVCKRIHKGDLEERGSYRYVLYEVFGFDMDAYVVGMNCGYLDIHNSIYTKQDIENIKKENPNERPADK